MLFVNTQFLLLDTYLYLNIKLINFIFFFLKDFLHIVKLFFQIFFYFNFTSNKKKRNVFNKKFLQFFFSHLLKDSFIKIVKIFIFLHYQISLVKAKSNSIVFYINSTNHSSEKLNKTFNLYCKNCFLSKIFIASKRNKNFIWSFKGRF